MPWLQCSFLTDLFLVRENSGESGAGAGWPELRCSCDHVFLSPPGVLGLCHTSTECWKTQALPLCPAIPGPIVSAKQGCVMGLWEGWGQGRKFLMTSCTTQILYLRKGGGVVSPRFPPDLSEASDTRGSQCNPCLLVRACLLALPPLQSESARLDSPVVRLQGVGVGSLSRQPTKGNTANQLFLEAPTLWDVEPTGAQRRRGRHESVHGSECSLGIKAQVVMLVVVCTCSWRQQDAQLLLISPSILFLPDADRAEGRG